MKPTLPKLPPNIAPIEGFTYVGLGPLKESLEGHKSAFRYNDSSSITPTVRHDNLGVSDFCHYFVENDSPYLNHFSKDTMKLTLQTVNLPNIQLPPNHVAFKISEQVGKFPKFLASNGLKIESLSAPAFDFKNKEFWLRGNLGSADNDIMVAENDHYRMIQSAVEEMLNQPKVLTYDPTKVYGYQNDNNSKSMLVNIEDNFARAERIGMRMKFNDWAEEYGKPDPNLKEFDSLPELYKWLASND